MKVNCLTCGFKIDLDDVYNDYEGQIKCFVCGTSLHLFTVHGKIMSLTPVAPATSEGGETETTVVKEVVVESVTTT